MADSVSLGSRLECARVMRRAVWQGTVAMLSAVLASCGGGGGSSDGDAGSGGDGGGIKPSPVSISYSTTSINFQAAKPYSPTPASQTIVGTVTGAAPTSTLYVIVTESNPQVATVSDFVVTGTTTGQATITPGSPRSLLAGSHQETLTVKACLDDPTCATGQIGGSPQTIRVDYDIGSSLDADTVAPRVVESNVAGKITLRGHGFSVGNTVTIGATAIPSSSISYYSDSDIAVSYPPLAAGTYPISIGSGGSSVSYSATLTVVDPIAYPASFLPYPGITPTAVQSLEYDAQRRAVFVVLTTSTGTVLLRYAYDGANWSSPTSAPIAGLQQIHLSPDGTKLLALVLASQQLSIAELDPVTLAQTADTPLPSSVATIFSEPNQEASFSLANDGNAIVVLNTGFTIAGPLAGTASAFAFVFGTNSRQFSLIGLPSDPLAPVSSGDGNIVVLRDVYNASGGTVSGLGDVPLGGFGSSSDLAGDKFVAPNPPSTYPGVYNSVSGGPMGYLPRMQGAVINSDGARVYVIENAQLDPSPNLHVFDSSAAPNGTAADYPELTPPLTLAGDPGVASSVAPLLTISVDSGTVFVAGASGIAVQPVAPE